MHAHLLKREAQRMSVKFAICFISVKISSEKSMILKILKLRSPLQLFSTTHIHISLPKCTKETLLNSVS